MTAQHESRSLPEPVQPTPCEQALERLADLLDEVVSKAEADGLRAHIEGCDPCTDAADAEEHVRALIRRACQESAPESLRFRIVSSLFIQRG